MAADRGGRRRLDGLFAVPVLAAANAAIRYLVGHDPYPSLEATEPHLPVDEPVESLSRTEPVDAEQVDE